VTRLLASVMTPAEAELALDGGADIIDLKNPAAGALGALPAPVLRACVAAAGGRRLVSATIGDLPLDPPRVAEAVARTAATGVDIVKIGLFAGDLPGGLAALRSSPTHRVAVLFADRAPDLSVLEPLAEAGFLGVMLDTADKAAGPLPSHLDRPALAGFVARARALGLLSGLAGSLRLADVPALAALRPDYLGFRGALCGAGGRAGALDPDALAAVRRALAAAQRPSAATATAGAQ
jgi:uncharacterized protein (UPF0264 family)